MTPDCLFYTGACDICPPDAGALPGEVSCGCLMADTSWTTADLLSRAIAPGTTIPLESSLKSDYDGDGDFEQELFLEDSKNAPNGQEQVRVYDHSGRLVQFEWEDIPQGPNGDYNDFMHFLSARQCSETDASGLPTWAIQSDAISYENGSSPVVCQQDCEASEAQQACATFGSLKGSIRNFVTVSVDRLNVDFNRESQGRFLRLTVATMADDSVSGMTVAVCPLLWFENPTPGMSFQKTINRRGVNLAPGLPCTFMCSSAPGPDLSCSPDNRPPTSNYDLNFSREMDAGPPTCFEPTTGLSDEFHVATQPSGLSELQIQYVAHRRLRGPDANPDGVGVGEPAGFTFLFWDSEW